MNKDLAHKDVEAELAREEKGLSGVMTVPFAVLAVLVALVVMFFLALSFYFEQQTHADPVRLSQVEQFKFIPEPEQGEILRVGELHNPLAVKQAKRQDKNLRIEMPKDDPAKVLIDLPRTDASKPDKKTRPTPSPQDAVASKPDKKTRPTPSPQDDVADPVLNDAMAEARVEQKKLEIQAALSAEEASKILPSSANSATPLPSSVLRAPQPRAQKPVAAKTEANPQALSDHVVQIASLVTAAEAEDWRRSILGTYGQDLSGHDVVVHRAAEQNIGVRYRVYVNGFADFASADQWCRKWEASSGRECLARPSS